MIALRLFLLLASVGILFGQRRELQEIQRDLATLQDQVRVLQRGFDEKMAQVHALVQQTVDASTKTGTAVAVLEGGIRDRMRDQDKTLAATVAQMGAKIDQMSSEFQFLREAVQDLSGRMNRLQTQLVDLGNAVKTLQAPPPPPGTAFGGTAPPGVSATALIQNARRDLSSGNLDLALQQFTDFLQYFGNTAEAPDAQFAIGEIHYNRGDFGAAVKAFDLLLEKYPENPKTEDAMYMKGMALLKGGDRAAAAQEFRNLLKRNPRSDLEDKAAAQLKALGLPVSGRSTKKRVK